MSSTDVITDLPELGKIYRNKSAISVYFHPKESHEANDYRMVIDHNFVFLGVRAQYWEIKFLDIALNKIVWVVIAAGQDLDEACSLEKMRCYLIDKYVLLSE